MSCSCSKKGCSGNIRDIPLSRKFVPSPDVEKRIVFSPARCWDDHVLRHFTLPAGAQVPMHSHDWPHYMIILGGQGESVIDGEHFPVAKDSWIFVPSNAEHTLMNTGSEPFTFLCIVPRRGDPEGEE
jgi:mannose-6-phosphate isomerase-like protein (cupin superfamily)